MRFLAFTLAVLLPSTLAAQDFLNVEEFEKFVTGKTMVFTEDNAPYGDEEFLPGRRVNWRYAGESACMSGTYSQKADYICFQYDDEDEDESCSTFWIEGEFLMSRFDDAPPEVPASVAYQTIMPMNCGLPYNGT